jgi:hypothetical protein
MILLPAAIYLATFGAPAHLNQPELIFQLCGENFCGPGGQSDPAVWDRNRQMMVPEGSVPGHEWQCNMQGRCIKGNGMLTLGKTK